MLRRSGWLPFVTILGLVALFIVALCSRAYWILGGPDWTYWLGNIAMESLIVSTGLVLVVGSTTSVKFIQRLYSVDDLGHKISRSKRISWILAGIFL